MDKDIMDYLKYYIGQSWQVTQLAGTFESGIYGTDIFNTLLLRELGLGNVAAKPILRKLESMTEQEIKELFRLRPWAQPDTVSKTSFDHGLIQIEGIKEGEYFSDWFDIRTLYPAQFHYLLSRGFDLFGLIDAGLALDKETIKS